MRDLESVAVIGLGLIGGSIARDLAGRGIRVLGFDHDHGALEAARAEGVVSAALEATLVGIDAADLVVVALPVRFAVRMLKTLALRTRDTVITDVGSTKRTIVSAAEEAGLGPRFVGSHPLTGDHRSGWGASRVGLFRRAPVFMTPGSSSPAAIRKVERLWRAIGARPQRLSTSEHDRLLARTSHLPQVIASALGMSLAREEVRPDELGPGGRGMTRLAASNPDLWADIAFDNRDELSAAVAQMQVALAEVRVLLASGNEPGLREWFARGRSWAEAPHTCAENGPPSVAAGRTEG
jgi:prephenate dehydrogenase